MIRYLHIIASVLAYTMMGTFWIATVLAELFMSDELIAVTKHDISVALLVFVPLILITGLTGFKMGRTSNNPVVTRKKRRMPWIAGNGLLILVPSAYFLSSRAQAGQFDSYFYTVQFIELIAGAVNIYLISLNLADGVRLRYQRKNT